MRIQSLEIQNIASLKGQHIIDFEKLCQNSDLFVITGPIGSGKSTILGAISLALYGSHYKSELKSSDFITLGESFGEILCHFRIGENYFEAYWKCQILSSKSLKPLKVPRISKSLKRNGILIEEKIEDILGLNFSQFSKTILLGQGQFAKYLTSPFSERREILERLSGLEILSKIGKSLRSQIKELDFKHLQLEKRLDDPLFDKETNVDELKIEITALKNKRDQLNSLSSNYQQLRQGIKALSQTLQKKNQQVGAGLVNDEALKANTFEENKLQQAFSQNEKNLADLESAFIEISPILKEAVKLSIQNEEKIQLKKSLEKKIHIKSSELAETVRAQSNFELQNTSVSEKWIAITSLVKKKWPELDGKDTGELNKLIKEQIERFHQLIRGLDKKEADGALRLQKIGHQIDIFKAKNQQLEKTLMHSTQISSQYSESAFELETLKSEFVEIEKKRAEYFDEKAINRCRELANTNGDCPVCNTKTEEELASVDQHTSLEQTRFESHKLKIEELKHQMVKLKAKIEHSLSSENELRRELSALLPEVSSQVPNQIGNELQNQKEQGLTLLSTISSEKQLLTTQLDQGKKWDSELALLIKNQTELTQMSQSLEKQKTRIIDSKKEIDGEVSELTKTITSTRELIFSKCHGENPNDKLSQLEKTITAARDAKQIAQNKYHQRLVESKELWTRKDQIKSYIRDLFTSFEIQLLELKASSREMDARPEHHPELEIVKFEKVVNFKITREHFCEQITHEFFNELEEITARNFEKVRLLCESRTSSYYESLAQLESLLKRQSYLKELKKEILSIKTTLDEKVYLYEVVGKEDFRNFALGLIEQNILMMANRELEELFDGRFQIIHSGEGNRKNEFYVVDRLHHDGIRKVSTLSGGETFLVSLALSLALSDLSSGRSQIDSLFIDEGFGSLDEEGLEEVLEVLLKLNQRGKQVGIISHVKQFTSQIPNQLHLEKNLFGETHIS